MAEHFIPAPAASTLLEAKTMQGGVENRLGEVSQDIRHRLDQVRDRIHKMRAYAMQKEVCLEEIPEYIGLETVLDELPFFIKMKDGTNSPHLGRGDLASDSNPDVPLSTSSDLGPERRSRKRWSLDPEPITLASSSSESGDFEGNNATSQSKNSNRHLTNRQIDHLGSFQNMSLGDVLSTTRRSHSIRNFDSSPEDGLGFSSQGSTPSPRNSAQQSRGRADTGSVPSLTEVLATSRRPKLYEKLSGAAQEEPRSVSK